MTTPPALALTVIESIKRDMEAGRIPSTVRSFSELHDFVDANEYVLDALEVHGEEQDSESDEQAHLCNRTMDMVTVWLGAK